VISVKQSVVYDIVLVLLS